MADESPTVARLLLGDRLRQLRTGARMDGNTAAAAIRASAAKISRMESGQVPLRERDVRDLLTLYGLSDEGERAALLDLAKRSCQPGWWDEFSDVLTASIRHHLSLESAAALIMTYDSQAVPALLQTDAYARGLTAGEPDEMTWRGGLSPQVLARRRAVLGASEPPRVWALIQESALHRAPGGNQEILAAQLASLRTLAAADPTITVQIVPDAAPAVLAAPGPFAVLRYGPANARDAPDLVLVEMLATIRCLERRTDVDHHRRLFDKLAVQAVRPDVTLEMLDDRIRTKPHAR